MDFGISANRFEKDGQEIKIISGAVHYFRNMPDTWRDIFKKLRGKGRLSEDDVKAAMK